MGRKTVESEVSRISLVSHISKARENVRDNDFNKNVYKHMHIVTNM